jgi:hypothetical protein
MNRHTLWIRDRINESHPDRSEHTRSVGELADACAALSGKGGQVFGMNLPHEVEDVEGLHTLACEALAAWFPHLEPEEAEQLATRIRTQGLEVPIPEELEDVDADTLEALCDRLYEAREQSLARLGEVQSGVLSRTTPALVDGNMIPWPTMMRGTQRLVRKAQSVLLVTDGLSNPWDPDIHGDDLPDWTFGFELALEVPLAEFSDPGVEAILSSWAPRVLWAATDWIVAERFDLMARVELHECTTHAILPVRELQHLVAENGFMGGLLGLPFATGVLGAGVRHGPEILGRPTWLLPIKLLTADEYEWATGVHDSSRARVLAELFLERAEDHLSSAHRPSLRAEAELRDKAR